MNTTITTNLYMRQSLAISGLVVEQAGNAVRIIVYL